MIITSSALDGITAGFSMAYNKGFEGLESIWPGIAMKTSSTHADETYGWLEKLPHMREWIGARVVNGLKVSGFTIKNRTFEQTIGVPRVQIEDDTYGLFAPLFTEMGRAAAEVPDKLVTDVLASGFTEECYDGQFFFDTDHPVVVEDGGSSSVSNMQAGSSEPWFLLDTSRAMKPFVYQERVPFGQLVSKNREQDDNVFMNDEFLYGSRGRGNAGFGLWQLAFGSKATLDATNYATARSSMMKMVGDNGRKLGIRPTTLVVGPDNEAAARAILNADALANGASNVWKASAKLIVTSWLDA